MKKFNLKIFIKNPELLILSLMAIYFLTIGIINPDFLSFNTIVRILFNAIILFFITLGVSIVITTKHVDVSVGSLLGLSATLGGTVLNSTGSIPLLLIVTLGTGILGGLLNGIGVAFLGVSAIIMTLGTMGMFRGLLISFTGGSWIQTVPEFYMEYSKIKFLGLPAMIWFAFIILIITWYLFTKTRYGRYFYAVGNNSRGALLQGIPADLITVLSFVISGFFAGIAALVYISQIGAIPNMAGTGMETEAIAAAVIGGVSLSGGKGNPIGAALGAILIQTINYSLVYLKLPGYWNSFISGFMLLSIIVFSQLLQKNLKKQREDKLQEKMKKKYKSETKTFSLQKQEG